MRKAASIMLAVAMVLGLTACSGGGEAATATTQAAATEGTTAKAAADAVTEAVGSEASAEGYTIGFSPYTLTNEYFVAVLDGVQRACEELGCELIYFDAQNDPTQQATQIDDMIASGIDALVYIPYEDVYKRQGIL